MFWLFSMYLNPIMKIFHQTKNLKTTFVHSRLWKFPRSIIVSIIIPMWSMSNLMEHWRKRKGTWRCCKRFFHGENKQTTATKDENEMDSKKVSLYVYHFHAKWITREILFVQFLFVIFLIGGGVSIHPPPPRHPLNGLIKKLKRIETYFRFRISAKTTRFANFIIAG